MRIKALAVLAAGLLAGGEAMADGRYDRKLDQAAAVIAAAKMGPLRGGFTPGDEPALFVPPPEERQERQARQAAPRLRPGEWRNGLAIAVERRSRVSPEL